MKPEDSKNHLTAFIQASGRTLAALTPAEGVAFMLKFYNDVRGEGCALDEDGDMLLYQWGVYEDLDGGESFHLDITRQFIVSEEDADAPMSQLSLTFFFKPPEKYQQLNNGNQWCSTPKELKKFQSRIEHTPAYKEVANVSPDDVKIEYSLT